MVFCSVIVTEALSIFAEDILVAARAVRAGTMELLLLGRMKLQSFLIPETRTRWLVGDSTLVVGHSR